MPNSAWSVRVWASSERSAQRCVRRIASATTSRGELGNTGWSKATAMSGPSACWTAIECSGVNRWIDPSRWLLNVDPVVVDHPQVAEATRPGSRPSR